MHILIIPSWYPTVQNEINGIFFKEQAKAIAKNNLRNKVGVISAVYLSILLAFKTKNFNYGIERTKYKNFSETIFNFPALPKTKIINQKIALYLCKRLFLQYIDEHGIPDIIHLHSFEMGELVLWINKTYNIKFVYTEHASVFYNNRLTKKEKKVIRNITQHASFNFAVSLKLSEILSIMFKIDFKVMPNFINTNFFKCQNEMKENIFTFINIANLLPNKNHSLLLKSFKKFQLKYSNSKLIIYGEGPERNKLEKLTDELNIKQKVVFGGKIDRQEVKKNLCKAHCFILTSKVETFGVVLIEAMSCCLPVISTNNGGASSIISNTNLGVITKHNEIEVYNAMNKIYTNYSKYNCTLIRQHIITNFSEHSIVQKILNSYNEALKDSIC